MVCATDAFSELFVVNKLDMATLSIGIKYNYINPKWPGLFWTSISWGGRLPPPRISVINRDIMIKFGTGVDLMVFVQFGKKIFKISTKVMQ